MVGLDVGDPVVAEISGSVGGEARTGERLYRWGCEVPDRSFGEVLRGTPMYDPLAVGVAIDPTLVKAPAMHVDVETRGESTRGETVANRHGYVERNVLHGDRYIFEGVDQVQAKRESVHRR